MMMQNVSYVAFRKVTEGVKYLKAIRIDGQTPGGVRTPLAEVIPLSTPFTVQMFPVYGCNLRCNYCIHSIPKIERGYISDEVLMDFALYKKCIDDLSQFPEKIKMLRFAGTGEPLLHKDIAKMVEYAAKKQVASSIDIVTNGLLLTPTLSKDLVNAGLTKIRISVQGIHSENYKHATETENFLDEFLYNLEFLYKNRGETKIYIKIIDCALQDDEEKVFFEMFGNLCDFIAIEHLIPAVDQIDYTKISKDKINMLLTQNGAELQEAEICPQPFYFMQINPDGKIVPCCAMETAYVMGDANVESLRDVWNVRRYNTFRKKHLLKEKNIYTVCKKCKQYRYMMFPEDVLDADAERLLVLF